MQCKTNNKHPSKHAGFSGEPYIDRRMTPVYERTTPTVKTVILVIATLQTYRKQTQTAIGYILTYAWIVTLAVLRGTVVTS